MNSVIEVEHLTRRYKDVVAVDDVSFRIAENQIVGLVGRNGAGKTTIMRLLTGLEVSSAGIVRVLGSDPLENEGVLQQVCFVRESQSYPDIRVGAVLASARLLLPEWDHPYALSLAADYSLPLKRRVRKLSRGMRSAMGIVIGLASRARVTLFDEPYLGLDAQSRAQFYDQLLADYAAHPRTVVVSTHLIDEVANLLERLIVIDRGRVMIDADADRLRGSATTVQGPSEVVASFTAGRRVLRSEALGQRLSAVVLGRLDERDAQAAAELHLDLTPLSMQRLVVLATADDYAEQVASDQSGNSVAEGASR
jgi:ABC-2 type transport system ATP-binding protein